MLDPHLGGEFGPSLGWLGGNLYYFARDIDLPAVEDAGQRVVLVAGQRQRGAAMGTALVEKADAAVSGAKGDEVLAQQADPLRRAIGFQGLRAQHGGPIF